MSSTTTTSASYAADWRYPFRVRWRILATSISERFAYRGDFIFSTAVRFLPIVTQVFLWSAIFANAKGDRLNGYTYGSMITYYLMVMLSRAFSSMPGLASGIALSVRDGSVRKYLTQPIDMLGYLFWHRVAHKLVYYVFAIWPFGIMFWLFREYFPAIPDGNVLAAWAASLIMGFLIGFLLESLIGLIAFWFLEVSSLIFIYMMINYLLSGHMIPLEWIDGVAPWVHYLPFKYLAYFPAAVFLGTVPKEHLGFELSVQASWIVVLLAANRVAFARGTRRYSAFGG